MPDSALNGHFRWEGADLLLRLRVSPQASRDQVSGLLADRLKVAITAPPIDGKANAHLVKYIGKQFGVAKSRVEVVNGQASRRKTVRISDPRKLPKCFMVTNKKH
ncbi:MAG: DUF167 family protein [Fuerstiella sp.]|nr:DUF167 family protein [Fuerstiella sp.]